MNCFLDEFEFSMCIEQANIIRDHSPLAIGCGFCIKEFSFKKRWDT